MKYENIVEGIFLERPNRFIAHVLIDGTEEICHVKNTGRCRELLIPGESVVFLEDHGNCAGRKTRYSLIAVQKGNYLINMDSQAPNKVAEEWLKEGKFRSGITYLKREQTYRTSRFDLYFEYVDEKDCLHRAFMEVKGVTLEEDGVVRFPDAPTERGEKHIKELMLAAEEGYEAYILFVIQMKGVRYFQPNYKTHRSFGEQLKKASQMGVQVLAYDCTVEKYSVKNRTDAPNLPSAICAEMKISMNLNQMVEVRF